MPQLHFETLLLDHEDGIATIRLNRPQALNAVNETMIRELIAAFDATDADDGIRAVILTATGDAFCAGADLTAGDLAFDYSGIDEGRDGGVCRDGGGQVTLRIFQSLKPVIAAITGAAVGAGATIPLAADIRLASSEARFGFVFARRGIVPESASSWFLPRIVGISTALEWCFSGRIVDADEARARGLVRSVHPRAELLAQAQQLARQFSIGAAPVSIALTRRMMWQMLGADHPMAAHRLDSRAIQRRGASADAREGVTSFLQKREPRFTDSVASELREVAEWWQDPPFI